MGSNNHTCRACGGHYFACDACDQRLGKSWRAMYCCEEHRQAYQDMIAYVRGTITKAQAKEALEKYGAQDWTESTSYPTICEIFAEDAPATVEEAPAVEEKAEEVVVEEPVEEVAAEQPVAEVAAEETEKPVADEHKQYNGNWNGNKNYNGNNYFKGKKRR